MLFVEIIPGLDCIRLNFKLEISSTNERITLSNQSLSISWTSGYTDQFKGHTNSLHNAQSLHAIKPKPRLMVPGPS